MKKEITFKKTNKKLHIWKSNKYNFTITTGESFLGNPIYILYLDDRDVMEFKTLNPAKKYANKVYEWRRKNPHLV
jgi:hypothetical protein